ncbi:MAG: hypothetical protein ABIR26_13560 [Ramlibacter sp.]
MTNLAKCCMVVITILGLTAQHGCSRHEDPNDYPVSYWLNDPDPCVRKTAAAIVASGRPWPNETLNDKHQLMRFDFWIGDQLYDLPAEVPIRYNNFSPKAHPLKYSVVTGNADAFLGVSQKERHVGSRHPGVPATLFGDVRCNSGELPSKWKENWWPMSTTRHEAIKYFAQAYESNRERVSRTEVNERTDIRMTEIKAFDRVTQGATSAMYFPTDRNLVQKVGDRSVIKPIHCHNAYDPGARVHLADLCHSWIYLGPGQWIEFQVHQQMLPIVPDIHDKLVSTFEKYRKN